MMKKTILLGVLAFFAINVITIQTATAQIGAHPKEKEEYKPKPRMVKPDKPTNSSNDNVQSEMRAKANDAALEAQVEQLLAEKSPAERQNLWRSLTNKSNKRNVSLTDKERIMLRLLNKEFKK
jgi:hypothetical protein